MIPGKGLDGDVPAHRLSIREWPAGERVPARGGQARARAQRRCGVIFAHYHPSGVAEPSAADRALTRRLVDALSLVEVRVLDHFVVGEGEPVSFAERGLS